MIRTFDAHNIRKQRELGGLWQLETLSESGDVTGTYSVLVPSCWESVRGLEDYRGRGRFSKQVYTGEGDSRLIFKGVSHTAEVWWDGICVAKHYNAYTSFEVALENHRAGWHTLEVVADNRFSEESSLHVPNDYRSYGGISRPIVIESVENIYIDLLHISPIRTEEGWQAGIKAVIKTVGDTIRCVNLQVDIADTTVDFGAVTCEGTTIVQKTVRLTDIEPWDTVNPKLYTVYGVLYDESGNAVDDLAERVGFREIRVDGDKLLLNGRPLFIKGFNRHEDYGNLGCAVPESIMNLDIDIILSTGANLVRTSHYPNDERFLDLCDERGVLVWEEAHARGLSLERMKNPNFKQQSADCISEMVSGHYNHPSIILWGILNECSSETEYGRECYTAQYNQLRELDKTRPLTSASCKHFTDKCLDLPDVVSMNIYPRWYVNDDPIVFMNRLKKYIDENGGKNKPLIISEFGAGAVYGYRTFSEAKWSEDRQATILREIITKLSEREDLSGLIIWQYCDCRVDEEFFKERPKTQNNKGIVDIYRQPKLGYYAVRDCFGQIETYRCAEEG